MATRQVLFRPRRIHSRDAHANEALAIGASAVLARALVQAQGVPSKAVTPGQTSEQCFKNLKVLNGLPADLMLPSMQFMEVSLGVHCVYYHDDDNAKRELDTKPQKATTRRMIQMVMDVNKNTFKARF